ncbi:MAG: PAS domain-containing sensor histidine kinase, partial [Pseudomonadota bacterium]
SLVALHLGELTVQSRLGEGTAVTVKLPLVYTPPQVKPANEKPSESKIATLTPVLRQDLQDQTQDEPAPVKKSA